MNKERGKYLYEFVGIIKDIQSKKIKHRAGLNLKVELTNYPEISIIQAWKDLLANEQIWVDLENSKFLDKKYLFSCQNWMGQYRLIDWQELTNHGSN